MAVPMTLRDAVNTLLRVAGITEVDSLVDTGLTKDSQNAINALNRANATVQSEGWNGNTEEEFPVEPNEAGEVEIPDNFLKVLADRRHSTWNKRISVRDGKLYNLTDRTFVWTDTVYLVVTQSLPFEDLPQGLRWLITCVAGRTYAVGTYPSAGSFRFTEDEETKARSIAEHEDGTQRDQTLVETSPYFATMRRR
jgi:hypothetical protein